VTTPTPLIVRLPAEKNLDRQLDVCRHTAKREKATVVIERVVERRDGSKQRIPILAVTPEGDIREMDAPALRVRLLDHTALAHLDYLEGGMNKRSAEGHALLNELGRQSQDYLDAERESRRQRPRGQKVTR
jgi:hypothetical protein